MASCCQEPAGTWMQFPVLRSSSRTRGDWVTGHGLFSCYDKMTPYLDLIATGLFCIGAHP